ncbi:MAG: hypothetical protein IT350_18425 [Deltaproteobacteria bacterium]|nr:hypothetical protein [Deltaproteobacteria bacterium]
METRTTVTLCLLIALAAVSACDCESPDSSDEASAKSDDDSLDDDSLNDDLDDDAGTTTTTSPTTTTTVVMTSSTTTTSLPGSGTPCDPYIATPEEIIPEVPYGPWPEFNFDGVIFQQIVASTAGAGRNDILVAPDGRVRILGQEGKSLDVWSIDPMTGDQTRETIEPFGGEVKNMDMDAEGNLHVVFTYRPFSNEDVRELRYATDESGDWEIATILVDDRGEYPEFDMEVDPDTDVVHLVYNQFERDDERVHYATWDHGVFSTEVLATPPLYSGWLNIDLDANGNPHVMYYDDDGMHYWRKTTGDWEDEIAHPEMAPWDLFIDAEGIVRVAGDGDADLALYSGYRTDDGWVFEKLDDCIDMLSSVTMDRDGAGNLHFVYSDRLGHNVRYATNASGEWVFYQIGTSALRNARNMISAVDAGGKIHIVHRQHYDYPIALFYDTNADGTWKRYGIAANHVFSTDKSVMDAEGGIHFLSTSDLYSRIHHGLLKDGVWSQELLDQEQESYSFPQDGAIAIGPNGVLHVVWGNEVDGYLRYGKKIGNDWEFENIMTGLNGFSDIHVAIDEAASPHVAFAGSNGVAQISRYIRKTGQDWIVEDINDTLFIADFILDEEEVPTVAYRGPVPVSDGPVLAHRIGADNWDEELIDELAIGTNSIYLQKATDGSLHALVGGMTTDYGLYYIHNDSGMWVTESLPVANAGYQEENMYIDNAGTAHFVASGTPDGESDDLSGFHYITNQSGQMEWHPILVDEVEFGSAKLFRLENGRFRSIGYTGASTVMVTFDPDSLP